MGCYEVFFGDIIGVGILMFIKLLLDDVLNEVDVSRVVVYFYDIYG